MNYSYNDGLLPAGRHPRLYLAKGGEVKKFRGENIPGWCAIATSQYKQNGKWSNTTYELELAPGVRALHFVSPMHGIWGDDLASWGAVTETLGLPVDVVQKLVRAEYPKTGERLDKLEEFALAVEAEGHETEVVVISFGSPTNRASREGYWGKSKSARTSDDRTVTILPTMGEYADWLKPVMVIPTTGKVISATHRSGMHGGYYTVEVAVPTGPWPADDTAAMEEGDSPADERHEEKQSTPPATPVGPRGPASTLGDLLARAGVK